MIKEIEIEFTLTTKVKVDFSVDNGDSHTPPSFEAMVVYHDFKDITDQIQQHVNENAKEYYE